MIPQAAGRPEAIQQSPRREPMDEQNTGAARWPNIEAALAAAGLQAVEKDNPTPALDAIEAHFEKTRATVVADLGDFNPSAIEGRLIKAGLTLLDRVERVLDGRAHVSLQLAEVPIERRTSPEAGPEYDGFVRFYPRPNAGDGEAAGED
jgi:hypothetical protein